MRPWAPLTTETRQRVLDRDHYSCVRCGTGVTKTTAKIDRIDHKRPDWNVLSNLRALCGRCYVLRIENLPHVDTAGALRDGVIEPDWRQHAWEG